jgi:hypothetical protein
VLEASDVETDDKRRNGLGGDGGFMSRVRVTLYFLAVNFDDLRRAAVRMAFNANEADPFYEIMRPPPDETPAQMTARLKREADAQRISDNIDEDIKRDRAQQRKARKELRILLLGQGESGTRSIQLPSHV